MLHGILDAIRNNTDKFIDNFLGLCRDTFILILGIHYRSHLLRRKNESGDFARRHQEAEESIRQLRDWMESEKGGTTQGGDVGQAAEQQDTVDSKRDSGIRGGNSSGKGHGVQKS